MEELIGIGMLIILAGFILILLGSILSVLKGKTKTESGFIFWIGPIPIIGATSKNMFYALLLVSIILFIFIVLKVRI